MDVVDAFCGAGGFSAGAMAVGCRVTTGVDRDSVPLKLWAANTGGRAVNATIGRDPVPWPDARPGLHVHFSPECTPLSKARSGGATRGEVDAALEGRRVPVPKTPPAGTGEFILIFSATCAIRLTSCFFNSNLTVQG